MRSRLSLTALLSIALLIPGGCPAPSDSSVPRGEAAYSSNSSVSASTSSAGDTSIGSASDTSTVAGARNPASTADALTNVFQDCREPVQAAEWKDEILRLVNRERTSRGLKALAWNDVLEEQASKYACELIYYDYFDHVNPVTKSTLRDRAGEFGYKYFVIGENLAAGQTSPQQAVTDWMNSPGHRENILDERFTELGIGIRTGGDYGLYWVQEFGRPDTETRP